MFEKTIENYCVRKLKKLNALCLKMKDRSYPDRLIILNDKLFFIEFKREKGRLSKRQEYKINELKNLGYKVYIVRNKKDLSKIIN